MTVDPSLSPIVLFVYNRLWHTERTIASLKLNLLANKSKLIIFSDAAKDIESQSKVQQVREFIKTVDGFGSIEIIERKSNLGLAKSVIQGVTQVINEHGQVIVLEDDLVTSPFFLKYMNESLAFYRSDERIFSITGFNLSSNFMKFPKGYSYDIYLNFRPMSWSWATWIENWNGLDWDIKNFDNFLKSRKNIFNFNKGGTDLTHMLKMQMKGQLDSWYIRWCYNAFTRDQFTIYPKISFVNNIGHDETGVHCKVDPNEIYSHKQLSTNDNVNFIKNIKINQSLVKEFNKAFDYPFRRKFKLYVKELLGYD